MATSTSRQDVITEEVNAKWYRALFEEDCIVIMKLLDDYPGLLTVGWEKEPERQVEGRERAEGEWRTSEWKGRTALHVGASRGCAKLILQVLRQFSLKGFSEVEAAFQKILLPDEAEAKSAHHDAQSIVDKEDSGEVIEKVETVSSTNSNEVTKKPQDTSDLADRTDTIAESSRGHQPELGETVGSGPQEGKACAAKEAETSDSASTTCSSGKQLQKTLSTTVSPAAHDLHRNEKTPSTPWLERKNTKRNHVTSSDANFDGFSPDMDCTRLLLAKDGESGLDAFAIAHLHDNKEVMVLLRYGLGKCDYNRDYYRGWNVDASKAIKWLVNLASRKREKRKVLRQVIVAAAMVFIERVEPYLDGLDLGKQIVADESNDLLGPPSTFHKRAFEEDLKSQSSSTMQSFPTDDKVRGHRIFRAYFQHRDFNFLPPEEYLFHFLCADRDNFPCTMFGSRGTQEESWSQLSLVCTGMVQTLWTAIRSWEGNDHLWRFLLQFKDSQGRPPFDVAIDAYSHVEVLQLLGSPGAKGIQVEIPGWFGLLPWKFMQDKEPCKVAMTTPDAVGRTPVHRAAATNRQSALITLLGASEEFSDFKATFHAPWRHNNANGTISWANGFHDDFHHDFGVSHQPIHAAIFHGHFDTATMLLESFPKWRANMTIQSECVREHEWKTDSGTVDRIMWDILEVACLVGAPPSFLKLFEDDLKKPRLYNIDKDGRKRFIKHPCHPLHIAAFLGSYDMVNFFIHDLECDPFIKDVEGNSALHHAMKVKEFRLAARLTDYVNSEQCSLSRRNGDSWMLKEEILGGTGIALRQGCINLLLQAGCDIFKINKKKQIPYPTGSLKDKDFLSWWYKTQKEEFTTAQNNLNFATNAIAITATLVATASYVGPLQPPQGYDSNHIQYANAWVSIFIVCDTLSFYLAIVAIILSLISALPMPEQAKMEELQRTRGMVTLAVGILLPSIFFVFLAFASSSISVMSANITSEIGGILTIVTTIIGAVLCFLAFILFVIRLLAFVFPRNSRIRCIYDWSNCITKFSLVS
ncbi:unnamed protein product [Calypogeia fissa]